MSEVSSPEFEIISASDPVPSNTPSPSPSEVTTPESESNSSLTASDQTEPEFPPVYQEPKFSICIIVKNGEATLGELAQSFDHFLKGGGQVVLLDTGSTDNTIELGRSLGFDVHIATKKYQVGMSKMEARKLLEKWCDPDEARRIPFRHGQTCFPFFEARNDAAALAKHDMVLHLDASDQLYSLDIDFLNTMIASGINSIYYGLSNKLKDSHAEGMATTNRFYDRRLQRWEGLAHEELYAIDSTVSSNIRMSTVPLEVLRVIHIRQENKSRDHYLIGVGLNVAKNPHNAQMVHNLGRQLFYAGFEASALKVLTKHLQMEFSITSRRSLSACFIAQIWIKRATVQQNQVKAEIEKLRALKREPDERTVLEMAKRVTKNLDEARLAYHKAFELDAGWRAPIMGLSDLSMRLKDYERAIFWARAAENIRRTSLVSEDASYYVYAIDETLMKAYYGLWKKAISEKAGNANQLFGEAYAAFQRCKESADWLGSVKQFEQLFQFDEEFARQSVQTGDFKE